MKKTLLMMLLMVTAFFVKASYAERAFPFKTAIISYVFSGSTQGEEVQYINLDENKMALHYRIKAPDENEESEPIWNEGISIKLGGYQYEFNNNSETVLKIDSDLDVVDILRHEEDFQMEPTGEAEFLGKTCNVYSNEEMEFYLWNQLVLRVVQKIGDSLNIKEAVDVKVDVDIPGEIFELPQDKEVLTMDEQYQRGVEEGVPDEY